MSIPLNEHEVLIGAVDQYDNGPYRVQNWEALQDKNITDDPGKFLDASTLEYLHRNHPGWQLWVRVVRDDNASRVKYVGTVLVLASPDAVEKFIEYQNGDNPVIR